MKKFWSKRIRDMVPYVPGEQPKDRKFIKLNTNENPYPPSPKALEAIRAAVGDGLRLYPDPECAELRDAIAEYHGLPSDMVFAGNGSDEILAFCFQAFFDPDRILLFPDVTYSFYPVFAALYGLQLKGQGIGGEMKPFPHTSAALDKKLRPLEHDPHFFQVIKVEKARSPGGKYAPGAGGADTGNAQKPA